MPPGSKEQGWTNGATRPWKLSDNEHRWRLGGGTAIQGVACQRERGSTCLNPSLLADLTWPQALALSCIGSMDRPLMMRVATMHVRGVCAASAKLRQKDTTNSHKTCRKHGAKSPQKGTKPSKKAQTLKIAFRGCGYLRQLATIATIRVWKPLWGLQRQSFRVVGRSTISSKSIPLYSRPERAGFGSIRRSAVNPWCSLNELECNEAFNLKLGVLARWGL